MTIHHKHKVTVRTKSGATFSGLAQTDDDANKMAEEILVARAKPGFVKLYEGVFTEGDYSLIDTDSIESITVRKVP